MEELNLLFYPNLARMTAGEKESCVVRNIWYVNRLSAIMMNLQDAGDVVLMPNLLQMEDLRFILLYRVDKIRKTHKSF